MCGNGKALGVGRALAALCVMTACAQAPHAPAARSREGRKMVNIQRRLDPLTLTDWTIQVEPLRRNGPPSRLAHAPVPAGDVYGRRYVNARENSRLAAVLPDGNWKVRREIPLRGPHPPTLLLRAPGRLLAEGGGAWQLFDEAGKPLADGTYGPSDVTLDGPSGLFYSVNAHSFLVANRLSNGEQVFKTSLNYGDLFVRPWVGRLGDRLFSVGVETRGNPDRPTPPDKSLIEFKEVTEPLAVNMLGTLTSVKRVGGIEIASSKLFAHLDEDGVMFSVPGQLYFAGLDLSPRRGLTGEFEFVAASRDEAGRTHAVVSAKGSLALWVLSAQGTLELEVAVPPELQRVTGPPMIGYDHRIYLLARGMLAAYDPDGQRLWQRPVSTETAGAGVTPNGRVLVSSGARLIAFDPEGNEVELVNFKGDTLRTPPVLTTGLDVYVAGATKIYCIERVR